MAEEANAPAEVLYVRKRDEKFVYPVSKRRLESGKFFPCDLKGNFISTGTDALESSASPAPRKDESDDHADEKDNSLLLAMQKRAQELKIKGWAKMKEETLIAAIEKAENKQD